ncbi:hypothetical protein M405DRAFT_827457 [Rhizopogon salebrosus TDB-379]|nr:hypothetical protein M405DRAFT_827457 [Rhizopogon salebrosus TDB-379]
MKPVQLACFFVLAAVGGAKPLVPACSIYNCLSECLASSAAANCAAHPDRPFTVNKFGCYTCCDCTYN